MGSDEVIVKFVHASDLHLGKAQFSNCYRAMDYINAFKQLLDVARDEIVDFVLLGGDVFNSIDILPFYFSQILDVLKNFHKRTHSKVPIYTIEGNHDIRRFSKGTRITQSISWLRVLSDLNLIQILDNLRLDVQDNGDSIQIANSVNIYGNSYYGEKIDGYIERMDNNISSNNDFTILLNHFGIQGQMQGIPGQSYSNLLPLKKKIDYFGLGHFHKQYIIDNWIFNPGCNIPVCLSDFNLPHGYFIVEVEKNKGYRINLKRKRHLDRIIIWKSTVIRSKYCTKQQFFSDIINHLKSSLRLRTDRFNPNNYAIPILCLKIQSNSGKILNTQTKKELRGIILQNYAVVDVHIFQKTILYKPIEGFFASSSSN
ncbi:MAG: metallophosphoesterase [Candidatus Lokiarchaeota archaeon]|nr:metallophosphoesterase [Candidatus Lokiarchaeota archaeon]